MSTIDKGIMKMLLKILQEGAKAYNQDIRETLNNYSQKITEREKHKEVEELLDLLFPGNLNETNSNLEAKKKLIFPDIHVFLVKNILYFFEKFFKRK